MEKKMFEFNTRTIVATAIGAALFTLLFMFVKIPTPIPDTSIQTAYGVGAFFATLFGPIAGFLIAFIGHGISDSVQYGSAWWSWVIASGVSCCIVGFTHTVIRADLGEFSKGRIALFNIVQIIGNAVSWMLIAPVLDIVMFAEPANYVFTQGVVAAIVNSISMGVIGTLLLFIYSKTRAGKGTLSKEDE